MIPLQDNKTSGRFPIITVLIILLNIYIFYLEFTSPNPDQFIYTYGLVPSLVDINNPVSFVPFITSMFLHGGLFHILSNMWFLWIFGDNVEQRFGWWYLPFYLLGGIVASLTQFYINPTSDIAIVGASGALAAVMGAYIYLFPHHTVKALVPIFFFITIINVPAIVMLGFWFFTQLFNGYAAIANTSAAEGGVAWFAHIGGFISGFIFAILVGKREPDNHSID